MPLYDRPYMRDPMAPDGPSAMVIIIGTCVGGFALQALVGIGSGSLDRLNPYLALSIDNLRTGFIWTLATYSLLHADILHLIFNLITVFFIGRILEPSLGRTRLLQLYGGGVLVGAAFWLILKAIHYQSASDFLASRVALTSLVGASAGVFAILAYFCIVRANESITLLLFFVLPVKMKPKWLGWGLLAYTLFSLAFYEARLDPRGGSIAHSAHLGGMAMGLAMVLWQRRGEPAPAFNRPGRAPLIEKPRWLQRKRTRRAPPPKQVVNITDRAELRSEVDRILDKINTQGFGSLSDEEKRVLDRARDVLNR
ncbi:MAG: rhomboid family intramembrane serine protease [Opitutales bacterium]